MSSMLHYNIALYSYIELYTFIYHSKTTKQSKTRQSKAELSTVNMLQSFCYNFAI